MNISPDEKDYEPLMWYRPGPPSDWYIKSTALVRLEDCPIYICYTGIWHYSDMNPEAKPWMVTHCRWVLVLPYSYSILTARYYGYRTR